MSKTSPQKISSIATLFLDTPPSCIEFSHLHPSYFVIGTYFLKNPEEQKEDQKEQGESQERNPSNESPPEKKSQERSGTLILCHLHETQIKIIHTLKTAHAILDLHFAHQKPGDERIQTNTFWTANSTGSIAEYELVFSEGTEKARIERRAVQQLYPKDVPTNPAQTPPKIPQRRYNSPPPPTPSLLLTGSYDDHIRLLRTTPRPSLLTDLNLNGGVWRLKLLSSKSGNGKWAYDILASCMHAGTRIVRLEMDGFMGGGARFVVLAAFEENESMNYGSDVRPRGRDGGEEERGEYTVVSTSFYDKRVCLWSFRDRAVG
ncbi:hypothetical protein Vi05172_g8650 [Venturia inaequalis]|nr:hypothetical protein Vi05172_g8650 [Venturia inaequalis]